MKIYHETRIAIGDFSPRRVFATYGGTRIRTAAVKNIDIYHRNRPPLIFTEVDVWNILTLLGRYARSERMGSAGVPSWKHSDNNITEYSTDRQTGIERGMTSWYSWFDSPMNIYYLPTINYFTVGHVLTQIVRMLCHCHYCAECINNV